jgi:hypothetical protein
MARQEFWTRPSATINQIVGYSYGYTQEKYGMLFYQLTVMSNNIHITVTDPTGDWFSEFFSCSQSMIARRLNAHYRLQENRWKVDNFGPVPLGDEDAVLDKMVYSIVNPVTAVFIEQGGAVAGRDDLDQGAMKAHSERISSDFTTTRRPSTRVPVGGATR